MARKKPQKTVPFTYFFAGVTGGKEEDIPPAWRERFYVGCKGPFPAYPAAREFPPGCITKHCPAGPGGGAGLLAAPYSVPLTMLHGALEYPQAETPLVELEIDVGVWLVIGVTFTPFNIMRQPLMAPIDIERVRCVTSRHDEPKHQWVIPCCLPMIDHMEKGVWRSLPRHEYCDIAKRAEVLVAGSFGQGEKPDREWMRDACCAAVAVNYEITPAELGALGLLGDEFYNAVGALLIGTGRGQPHVQ